MRQVFYFLAGVAVVGMALWVASVEPGAGQGAGFDPAVDPFLARSIPGLLVFGVIAVAVVLWVGPRPDGSSGMGRGTAAMFVVLLLVSLFLLFGVVRSENGAALMAALWQSTGP